MTFSAAFVAVITRPPFAMVTPLKMLPEVP